jgi:hypothetical protein
MGTIGQPTGGSLKPGSQGPEGTIVQIGPTISIGGLTPAPTAAPPPEQAEVPDPDAVPKFTITETRSVESKFGEPPRHTRKFRAVQEIIPGLTSARRDVTNYVNASVNSPHPDFPGCILTEFSSQETVEDTERTKQFITEITCVYSVPPQEQGAADQHPLTRPDTWSFQTQGASIAVYNYFDGENNATVKPLTNSAGDYIKGLTADEAQTKVVIKGNRAVFPAGLATALTNCVNQAVWLGGGQDCWKCQGISGQLKYETVNEILVGYWEVTVELLYRQTGWNHLIPDIGFNFIAAGQKRRAMVFDQQNNEWVASAEPVALDGAGAMKAAGNAPEILTRRVYRRIDFNNYFGSPPS